MLKNIKDKKIIIILGAILLTLLVISAIVIIKVNKSKETKEAVQQIEQEEKEETESISTQIQEESLEEPPFLIDQISEEEPEETEKTAQIKTQTSKYYIKVNNQANVVTIYTKDSNGNYTVPYKAMVCSIGTATPTGGVYTIPGKTWDRWTWGQMVGGVWAQYYVRIKGSILFHSVPYTNKDKSTLEYWEYDKLGTQASAGCIRLTVADAKWIYDNCPAGTQVEFYYDSNPGPLGKPTAQKISGEESVRGWDPTDPSSENPWKNYVPTVVEQPETSVVEEPEQPPVENPPIEEPSEDLDEEQPSKVPGEDTEGNQPTDDEKPEEQPPEEQKPPEEEQPPKETDEDVEAKPTEKPDGNNYEEQQPEEDLNKTQI